MNTNYCPMKYKKESGFLLVAALGFIVVFSFLVFVVTQQLVIASNAQLLSMLSMQANNAGNSGVEEGVYRIVNHVQSKQYCEKMNLQRQLSNPGLKNCSVNISCSVTFAEDEPENKASLYLVSSQARCGSGSVYSTQTVDMSLLHLKQANDQEYRVIYRQIK